MRRSLLFFALTFLVGLGCQAPQGTPITQVTRQAATQPTTQPSKQSVTMKAASETEGTLVVTFTCYGEYACFLWGNDIDSGIPAFPYCWDVTKPWIKGDVNFDGYVTFVDLTETVGLCMSGPNIPYPTMKNGRRIRCDLADLDEDGDVDMDDFGMMQVLINGWSFSYREPELD